MKILLKFSLIVVVSFFALSCTNFNTSNLITPTPTQYVPVSIGTPLPLVYKPITSQTAKNITLLANWKTDLPVADLVFASDRDLLCLGNQVVTDNWDIFSYEIISDPKNCRVSYKNTSDALFNLQTLVYSSDHKYSVEVDSVALLLNDLVNTDRSLFLYSKGSTTVEFSPNGKYLLIAFDTGKVWFVPMKEIEQLLNEENPIDYVSQLLPDLIIDIGKAPLKIYFSNNTSLMAFILEDQTMQVWDVPSLSMISTIHDYVPPLPPNSTQSSSNDLLQSRLAFSPNNELVTIAYTENNTSYIRLWDVKTGKVIISLQGCQGHKRISALAFSPTNRALAALYDGTWICVWGVLPDSLAQAQIGATEIAKSLINANTPIPNFPMPTVTPTSGLPDYRSTSPLAWPISMPTDKQILEAKQCSVEIEAGFRYDPDDNYSEYERSQPLEAPCNWAALAAAYQLNPANSEKIPEESKRAFFETIRQNPAFALTNPLFYMYFNSMDIVEAPPFSNQPITSFQLEYNWEGMGDPSKVSYQIEGTNLDSEKNLLRINGKRTSQEIQPETIQNIGKSLKNFLPVKTPFSLQPCTDNTPDWKLNLTFLDGTSISLQTYQSNLLTIGGPWFMELDGQYFIQFSTGLAVAVFDLFDELELSLGLPYGTTCSMDDPFNLAFP